MDWFDDPDSRVDVVGTATDDLRGVWRLRKALASGSLPLAAINDRMGRGRVTLPGVAGAIAVNHRR